MWETYRQIAFKYPRILLEEERQLIAQAKGNSKAKAEEIVLRHVGFVIRRIHKKHSRRIWRGMGEDILSEPFLFCMIKSRPMIWSTKTGKGI